MIKLDLSLALSLLLLLVPSMDNGRMNGNKH